MSGLIWIQTNTPTAFLKEFFEKVDFVNNQQRDHKKAQKITQGAQVLIMLLRGIYFVIYGIISEFTDKGQFQYLTNLKGPQEWTYLYTTQFLPLR